MIPEAQLLIAAVQVLEEVLGRIRPQDSDIELPTLYPGAPAATMADALVRLLLGDAVLAATLAGTGTGAGVGTDEDAVASHARALCQAAAQVDDGGAVVEGGDGPEPVRELLLRATIERSLLAHYVAAYLGSTACPLPEELAKPLWELTAKDAAAWRARGHFRPPMLLPDHVSWRDRFLLDAGHEPHPLGH